ncbi:hypothetical protein CROQUDRAFT_654883 [Cronartium quercuum f. sp. fusiforme G11]|uniref:Uncharacterized protein n=1 Tax=Cronartium quercuum f. sp. fusiforme G11 TaxID=708437 RepID=A0A9P6NJX3_9BASI|nr:hypothetical protein CROQUDRAFT_654883 [Cronartium quercuum f. sp. fusiforme G11]
MYLPFRSISFISLTLATCWLVRATAVYQRKSLEAGHTRIIGDEIITCNQTPAKVNRNTIINFIQSFCAEVIGQEFRSSSNDSIKETYPITTTSLETPTTATYVELGLRTVNGCDFVVDDSCGRFLTRPTDECNIGEEEKQGGVVTDGCSFWTASPIAS